MFLRERWSVWWAVVRFEDDPNESKIRPVVVLDDKAAFCISLKVTSQKKDDRYYVKLKQWEAAGLSEPSWVRVVGTLSLKDEDFISKIGMLDMDDIYVIMRRIR